MKPKYYTYFPLFLLACGNKTEVKKDNVVDSFCKKVGTLNAQKAGVNDYVALAQTYTKGLTPSQYQEIFRRLCAQQYQAGVIYSVLYAFLQAMCINFLVAQNILKYLKENANSHYCQLVNYVQVKANENTNTDKATKEIAKLFHLDLSSKPKITTIEIPKTIEFKPAGKEKDPNFKVDDIKNLSTWVKFENCKRGSVENSWDKLSSIVKTGNFNDAIRFLDKENIKNHTGDSIADLDCWGKITLNDEGLKNLCDFIPDDKKISDFNHLKKLLPALKMVKNLEPLFKKTEVKVNLPILKELTCFKYCNDVLKSIPDDCLNKKCDGDSVIKTFLNKKIKLDEDALKKLLSMMTLVIDANNLIKFCCNNTFKVKSSLCRLFKDHAVLEGDELLSAFTQNPDATVMNIISKVKFNQDDLNNIVDTIDDFLPFSNTNNLIKFCCNNIDFSDTYNVDKILEKYDKEYFDSHCLKKLIAKGNDMFNKVMPLFSTFKKYSGDYIIGAFLNKDIKLRGAALIKVLAMIETNNAFSSYKIKDATKLIKFCCNNIDFDSVINLDVVVRKYDSFSGKFDLNCLNALISQGSENFNKIMPLFSNFGQYRGNEIIDAFMGKDIQLNKTALEKVVGMISREFWMSNREISNADKLIQFCCNNIDFTSDNKVESLDLVFDRYLRGFDHSCLKELIAQGKDKFDRIFSLISADKLSKICKGNDVIDAFFSEEGKKIQLDNTALGKIVSMIGDNNKITDANKLIPFCCNNIDPNVNSLDPIIGKYGKHGKFGFNCLKELIDQGNNNFLHVIKRISQFKQRKGDKIISAFRNKDIKLDQDALSKVLSMINPTTPITKVRLLTHFCMKYCDPKDFNLIKNLVGNLNFDLFYKTVFSRINNSNKDQIATFVSTFFEKTSGQISLDAQDDTVKKFCVFAYYCYLKSIKLTDVVKKIADVNFETSKSKIKNFYTVENLESIGDKVDIAIFNGEFKDALFKSLDSRELGIGQ